MRARRDARFGRTTALAFACTLGAAAALAVATAGCGDDAVDPTYLTLVDASRPVFGQPPRDAGPDAPDAN